MQKPDIKFRMTPKLEKLIKAVQEVQNKLISLYSVQIPTKEALVEINTIHNEHNRKMQEIKEEYDKHRESENDPKKWEKLWQTQAELQAKLMIENTNREITTVNKLRAENIKVPIPKIEIIKKNVKR